MDSLPLKPGSTAATTVTGDTVAAFSLVLERGELEDLAHIMKLVGPRPHVSTGA